MDSPNTKETNPMNMGKILSNKGWGFQYNKTMLNACAVSYMEDIQ